MLDNWISVLQAKVQDYYKQMNDMVMETYSVEDQQIIGCPSIQQVCFMAVCDSYTVKFSGTEKWRFFFFPDSTNMELLSKDKQ